MATAMDLTEQICRDHIARQVDVVRYEGHPIRVRELQPIELVHHRKKRQQDGLGARALFLTLHEQDCVHAKEAEDCVYRVNTAHAAYRLIFFPAPPRVDRAVPMEPGLLTEHVRAHDQLRQEGDRPNNRVSTLTSLHTHMA